MSILYLSGPPFPGGETDYPVAFSFPYDSETVVVAADVPSDSVFALIAAPYDSTVRVDLAGLPLPGGEMDIVEPFTFTIFGATRDVYIATDPFRTKPVDAPASVYFADGLAEPANLRVTLFSGAEPQGDVQRNEGEIRITDPSGDLDSWIDYGWEARRVDLYRGRREDFARFKRSPGVTGTPWSSFTKVATATTAGLKYDLKEKTLMLRAMQDVFYRQPLLHVQFGGTGRLDGDEGARGRLAPQIYGPVFNVVPVLINAANGVYMIHDRKIDAVVAVKDGGSPLDATTDYPGWDALVAATVGVGEYATCLALGLIRTGATPVYGYRVDARGDAEMRDGYGYLSGRAAIARRIVTTRGAQPLNFETEVNHQSVQRLDMLQPAPVGFAFTSETTVGAALDQIMMGCAGWWFVSEEPQFYTGLLLDPADLDAEIVFHFPADFVAEPEMQTYVTPRDFTRMTYRENYGPQTPGELATGLTADEQRIFGERFSFAPWGDERVHTRHPDARNVAVPAGFGDYSSALAEAARQQQLFGVRRERWRMPVRYAPFSRVLGRVIEIRGFNRYGFGSSRKFICVGVSAKASSNRVELDLWG